MKLFASDVCTVTRIQTVQNYKSTETGEIKNYTPTLRTYELIFFLSGERETRYGTKTAHEPPDTLRYLPKGISAGIYTVKLLKEGTCIDVYFDTEDEMPDHMISVKDMGALRPLFTKIYNIWQSKRTAYYPEAMSVFYEIIRLIKQKNEQYTTNSQAERIIPAYEYMLANFTNPGFDFKAMCRESGLSYDYFKQLFIAEFGVSPVKQLTSLRMERARELLITGQYKIGEIAAMCGFDDMHYFSRAFKNFHGVPPGIFRSTPANYADIENLTDVQKFQ